MSGFQEELLVSTILVMALHTSEYKISDVDALARDLKLPHKKHVTPHHHCMSCDAG